MSFLMLLLLLIYYLFMAIEKEFPAIALESLCFKYNPTTISHHFKANRASPSLLQTETLHIFPELITLFHTV